MRLLSWSLALSLIAFAGCEGRGEPDLPDAGDDVADAGPQPLQFLSTLNDESSLALLRGEGGDLKYLAQVEGAAITAPILDPCVFQNTALYPFHLQFLVKQPGGQDLSFDDYVAFVLRRQTRVWWGGEVAYLPTTPHPITGVPGVLAWSIYTEDSNGNRLTLDDVRAGHARLAGCAPGFEGALAYAPASNEQLATARSGQAQLQSEGIAVLLP